MSKTDKLNKTIDEINARFGPGTIGTAASYPKWHGDSISTGSIMLDRAIGVGGVPRGRTTVIWGRQSSGKSTLCQHLVANAQKDGIAAYIDVEHALDPAYAKRCGVDWDALLLSQPSSGEEALEVVEGLARTGEVSIIVVDSVAKLVPRSEIEGNMGDAQMGAQARLMSQAMRKLGPVIGKNNVALVFTNQIRNKIGVVYGSPEYAPGGEALNFDSSVIIKTRAVGAGKEEGHVQIEAKVTKNKVAPPFLVATFDIYYNRGIDRVPDVLTAAVEDGVIEKRGGGNYDFDGQSWRGWDNLVEAMRENPVFEKIEAAVRA